MAFIAYSVDSGTDPMLMDSADNLYLGYTFHIQNLVDAFNDILITNGHSDVQIGPFDYEVSFTKTSTGFEFYIKNTNLLVLWQDIAITPEEIDVFGAGSQYIRDDTGGIVYGGEFAAASVFDYVSFEYVFETTDFGGVNTYTEGRVTTHYNIGETNLLITRDNTDFITSNAESWTGNPFTAASSYTLTIPEALAEADFSLFPDIPDFPDEVTVALPELAFLYIK